MAAVGVIGANLFLEGASPPLPVESLDSCTNYTAPDVNPLEKLPLLIPPEVDPTEGPQLLTSVGNAAIKNSRLVFTDDELKLPGSYRDALAYSFADPLTGCLIVRHTADGIDIYQWGDNEGAEVSSSTDHKISVLLTHDPGARRVFTTPEAMRRTITHEAGHTFFNTWLEAAEKDEGGARLAFAEANDAYTAQLEAAFEGLRRERGPALAQTIRALGADLRRHGQNGVADAADELVDRLFRPDGLRGLTAFCPPHSEYCSMKSLVRILVTVAERRGGDVLDKTDMKTLGIDVTPLDTAQVSIAQYMLRHFSISDESRIFGVHEWTGWPYKSTSEYVASVLASDQNAPDKVIQQLYLLSPQARARELAIRQAIVDGAAVIDPALLPMMETNRILVEFSRG